ncbi:MAG: tetratricopeptide repeat protein [Candidatus Glassbacteria bacterium]|nr:tetratricopeptide repeat protein [Candidatus Glassbacteria bacterium]
MKKGGVIPLVVAGLLAGCAGPSYIDEGKEESSAANPFSKVFFRVHDAYNDDPPDCVAVMPFTTPEDGASQAEDINLDQTETVRRALYAHLSPQGKRDVEIPRIDFVLGRMSDTEKNDFGLVGKNLNCGTLVVGEVTEYGSSFFGIYSRVAVGAELKMIRADDGSLLWEGRHVAASHGGDVPLSPIGLAMGIVKAASNLNEEQIFRVIDDLARRLVKTIPDNRIAVLEEPLSPMLVAVRREPKDATTAQDLLAALEDQPFDERKSVLIEAIEGGRFGDDGTRKLHEALIELAPSEAESHARYARYLVDQGDYDGAIKYTDRTLELNDRDHGTHFLKARILVKLDDLDGADSSIVRAVALDDGNADYFNGLGYVNSLRGNSDRALAAYRMSLDRDPVNGFAYYNTGVTLFNLGNLEEAASAFYGAGLSYLKSGDYGQTEKAVVDLKDLASQGIDLDDEIKILEEALKALTKGEGEDV